jgi:hypothetical protein
MAAQGNESNTSTDPILKPESSEVISSPDPESESASNAASAVRIILEPNIRPTDSDYHRRMNGL